MKSQFSMEQNQTHNPLTGNPFEMDCKNAVRLTPNSIYRNMTIGKTPLPPKQSTQRAQQQQQQIPSSETPLPVLSPYYQTIGEFNYNSSFSTEMLRGTTIDYVSEEVEKDKREIRQVNREWKMHVLRIPNVFAHVTLGGILSKNDLLSLGSYIKNEIFTKQDKTPKYVEITQNNPTLGRASKIKIIKYTMTDYIPITRAILSWLELNNNSSHVIYAR